MKTRTIFAVFLLIPFLFTSIVQAEEPVPLVEKPAVEDSAFIIDQGEFFINRPKLSPDITWRGLMMYGLNWFPEKVTKFSKIKRDYRGTKTRVNTPGSYYVNISIPTLFQINGVSQKLYSVVFCGQSSKGAKTKPVRWKLYEYGQKFSDNTFSWLPNENYQCVETTIASRPTSNLMVSVLVNYHNTTHTFTFKEAYAYMED